MDISVVLVLFFLPFFLAHLAGGYSRTICRCTWGKPHIVELDGGCCGLWFVTVPSELSMLFL